ncbi:MAG: hypothetical protein PHP51_08665 [Desulfotomaculaceae bacterium]|nr:hypothetical protein [Desulfotomaculaceae bacterium]
MAQIISIGSGRLIDLLKTRMGRELKLFKDDGFKVDLVKVPPASLLFWLSVFPKAAPPAARWRKPRIFLNITWPTASQILF